MALGPRMQLVSGQVRHGRAGGTRACWNVTSGREPTDSPSNGGHVDSEQANRVRRLVGRSLPRHRWPGGRAPQGIRRAAPAHLVRRYHTVCQRPRPECLRRRRSADELRSFLGDLNAALRLDATIPSDPSHEDPVDNLIWVSFVENAKGLPGDEDESLREKMRSFQNLAMSSATTSRFIAHVVRRALPRQAAAASLGLRFRRLVRRSRRSSETGSNRRMFGIASQHSQAKRVTIYNGWESIRTARHGNNITTTRTEYG
jgi:hypothetical protein